jgi:sirohydrochlorin ferrochelatase
MSARSVLLVAHGSTEPAAAAVAHDVAEALRRRLPCTTVEVAFLSHGEDTVVDVLTGLARRSDVMVVPLLLAPGHHVDVDIDEAVTAVRAMHESRVTVAPPLGPHPLLSSAVVDRLRESGLEKGRPAVVLLAGALTASALAEAAEPLAASGGWDVRAVEVDEVPAAIDDARRKGANVVAVAPYVIAPGAFASRIQDAGRAANFVAAPIGAHADLVRVVVDRATDAPVGALR